MMRTALLAGSALWILAATPALADGMDKRLTGLGDVGYYYSAFDEDNTTDDFDADSFHGAGSALWTWNNGLNVQGDFLFATNRFETDAGVEQTVDNWAIGGGVFWRDPKQGAYGAEVHYQSLDVGGDFADGFNAAARGEIYFTKAMTLAGYAGYSSFDRTAFELDGWQLGLQGTYYANPHLALRLRGDYGNWDVDTLVDEVDEWFGGAEVEYLIPGCTTSLYLGGGYGSYDFDVGPDVDYWTIGGGVRIHLGQDAGPLVTMNRSEPIQTLRTRFAY